jgi:hypothetical protein
MTRTKCALAIAAAVALLFVSSIWLNAHAGLALIVDPVTGAKGCVNMLSQYVGLDEADWRFSVVNWFSFLWLPIAAIAILALVFWAVRRLRE